MKVYILNPILRHTMGLTVSQFSQWVNKELVLNGFDLDKPIRNVYNDDSGKVKIEQEN